MKTRLIYCLVYFIAASYSNLAFADDESFDFSVGEEEQAPSSQPSTVPFSLPGDLQLSFDAGRQLQKPARWMQLGPEARLLLSTFTRLGNLNFESYARYNFAYQAEGDDKSLVDDESFDAQVNELFLQKSSNQVTVTTGLVKLAWGVGDLVSILDVISPRDNREFLNTKPKDQRIGQLVVGVDYWFTNFESSSLSFLVIPRPQNSLSPHHQHPYSLNTIALPQQNPHPSPEGAIRFKKEGGSMSLGVYYANIHERDLFIKTGDVPEQPFVLFYPHKKFMGLDFTYNLSPVLFKAEFVMEDSKAFQGEETVANNTVIMDTYYISSKGLMLGLDFNDDQWGSFSLEGRHWFLSDRRGVHIGVIQRSLGGAFWSKNFYRDEIRASIGASFLGNIQDILSILNIEYSPRDNWIYNVKYSYLDFKTSEEPFASMDAWDRIQLGVKYNFDMR